MVSIDEKPITKYIKFKKRHYDDIAYILRTCLLKGEIKLIEVNFLIDEFSKYFINDNAKFNKEKFSQLIKRGMSVDG